MKSNDKDRKQLKKKLSPNINDYNYSVNNNNPFYPIKYFVTKKSKK